LHYNLLENEDKRPLTKEFIMADLVEELFNFYLEKGWTDGLPIIPPTAENVKMMMSGTHREPREIIGAIPPAWAEATIERIARYAVMAGCLPEYMPVLIAAISAMCEEEFRLAFMQPTTEPIAPLLIINGPIVKKLDINAKSGAFGPGWRANATIGRAIRLILANIGGAFPGITDMSTQGQPGKYTFCIAENENDSPWEPLSVERGFSAETSTVSVVGVENPHNINDHDALNADEVLSTIAGTMATLGNNHVRGLGGDAVLAFGPEHAATIAKDGFSKQSVIDYLYERARVPRRAFYERAREKHYSGMPADSMIPPTIRKENLHIIVVGGPGKHSSYLPGHVSHMVTKAIQ
jgi:hypothetical protein